MAAVPADWPVTVPDEDTVATCVSDDDQVTIPFIDRWLPSLNLPTAL
jgi:hypothetical protein